MNLNNVSGSIQSIATDKSANTLVLFAYSHDKKVHCDAKDESSSRELIKKSNDDGKFKAGLKECLFFRGVKADGFENLLAVGLGEKKSVTEESLRVAMATAAKALSREKAQGACVHVDSLRKLTKSAEGAGRAMTEGALLGCYKYDELKSKKKSEGESKEFKDLFFVVSDKPSSRKFGDGIETGKVLADCTNFARDLGNAPGNYLTPAEFSDRFEKAVKGLPIKFKSLHKKEIKELKMGCLLGVNKGSAEEPRFMIAEYHGGKKSDHPLILVGKGLTFDSGGISIKPSAGMEEMKFDMCGGAAVAGALLACAKLKLKKNIVALIPSTENMPGGDAVKPGDVLVAMNEKTVEVNNTDAEGRLILADALSYACQHYKPAAIVDAATLTGACVVALGNVFSGYFCNDEGFRKKIVAAAEASGERIWQLPLTDDYVEDMKGTYADLSNVGAAKGGGSSQGAAFLSQFVDKEIKWAHFDIAGSAWHTGNRYPYNPDKGASGAAVRLFTQLAMLF